MARRQRDLEDPDEPKRSKGQKAYWDKVDQIAGHFSKIMEVLGLDLESAHLQGTPDRVGRMYLEIFRGLEAGSEPTFTTFPNEEHYSNMVIVKDIEFFSVCAHHMIPFFGKAHVAYIPDQQIVGLSKIPRVVDFYARRPQLQERLTEQVIDLLVEKLAPQGAIVVMEARHLCMEMRGVEKPRAYTTTSAIRGCFEDKVVRQEFLDLLMKDSKDL